MTKKNDDAPEIDKKSGSAHTETEAAQKQQKSGFVFAEWWEKNKAAQNAKRRERRAKDPEYRTSAREWNKTSRTRAKVQSEKDPTKRKNHTDYRSIVIDGCVYYTIGAVAKLVGCSRQAVRRWEEAGTIPKPELSPTDTTHRQRFYSWQQVRDIHRLMKGKVDSQTEEDLMHPFDVRWADGSYSSAVFVRVGFVAAVTERAVSTILRYENDKRLPLTPFVSGNVLQNRYYTLEMVEVISSALAEHEDARKLHRAPAMTLHDSVLDGWARLNVISADRQTTASLVPSSPQ